MRLKSEGLPRRAQGRAAAAAAAVDVAQRAARAPQLQDTNVGRWAEVERNLGGTRGASALEARACPELRPAMA